MISYITESTGNQMNPILILTTELTAMRYKLRSKIRFPPAKPIRMRSKVSAWKTKKWIKERVMTETERYKERVALQIRDGIVISIGKAVQSCVCDMGYKKCRELEVQEKVGEMVRDSPTSPNPYRQSHYDT
jgi:hypothetical protein